MKRRSLLCLSLLTLLLTACQQAALPQIGVASRAWIDAPLSGTRVQPGTAVPVLAHWSAEESEMRCHAGRDIYPFELESLPATFTVGSRAEDGCEVDVRIEAVGP